MAGLREILGQVEVLQLCASSAPKQEASDLFNSAHA